MPANLRLRSRAVVRTLEAVAWPHNKGRAQASSGSSADHTNATAAKLANAAITLRIEAVRADRSDIVTANSVAGKKQTLPLGSSHGSQGTKSANQ